MSRREQLAAITGHVVDIDAAWTVPGKSAEPKAFEELDSLAAVRKRPKMYLGHVEAEALTTELFAQAGCHAIDEAIEGTCTRLGISLEAQGATVSYDAGMSLREHDGETVAYRMLATLRACHNLKKHLTVGEKFCSLGLVILNAFSKRFEVHTVCGGRAGVYLFRQGKLIAHALSDSQGPEQTSLRFALDETLLGDNVEFNTARITELADTLQREVDGLSVIAEFAKRVE